MGGFMKISLKEWNGEYYRRLLGTTHQNTSRKIAEIALNNPRALKFNEDY